MSTLINNDEVKKKEKEWRPMWNLVIISLSFLLVFSAYASLEFVQSSLNSEVGTLSLSATYTSLVVSSLVLPPLIIDKLGFKKSMAVGVIGYAVYIGANFYPRTYTMIPAGILLGAGASVLWSAKRVYITNLALHATGGDRKKAEKRIGYFYGIFYALYSMSGLGNIIMSILLSMETTQTDPVVATLPSGTNSTNYTQPFIGTTITPDMIQVQNETRCGIPASRNWEITPDHENRDDGSKVDITMLYILLSIYLSLAFVAIFLLLFAIDEVPEFHVERIQINKKLKRKKSENKDLLDNEEKEKERQEEEKTEEKLIDNKEEEEEERTEKLMADEEQVERLSEVHGSLIIPKTSSKSLILATMRLLATNRQMQLIIPCTVQFGVLHAIMAIHFMKFWITCSLGIGYVGYAALTYGIVASGTAYSVGWLLKWFRRVTLFTVACIFEIVCLVSIMLWAPPRESEPYLFFLWISILSVSHTSHRCINNTVFGIYFVEDKAASQSALGFLDSLGRAIIYGVAAFIRVEVQVYIVSTLLALGALLYYISEWRHLKARKSREQNELSMSFTVPGNALLSDNALKDATETDGITL